VESCSKEIHFKTIKNNGAILILESLNYK